MRLEKKVEEIYGKFCFVFNLGFDVNLLVIEIFFDKKFLIIIDRLNYVSIYEGCINLRVKILRYKYLDVSVLEKLLKKYFENYNDILVVIEIVYSMDGDCVEIK